MGRKSIRKGHDFERKVAKLLSKWWGEAGAFVRVPLSGGWRFSSDKKVLANTYGDIVTPEGFPWVISCKKVENFEFHRIFEPRNEFWQWWEEVECLAFKADKKPMLIFSRNRIPIFYCVKYSDWRELNIPSEVVISIFHQTYGKLIVDKLGNFLNNALKDTVILLG